MGMILYVVKGVPPVHAHVILSMLQLINILFLLILKMSKQRLLLMLLLYPKQWNLLILSSLWVLGRDGIQESHSDSVTDSCIEYELKIDKILRSFTVRSF